MSNSNKRAALFGAFCADAYALGSHWVYSCDVIEDASLDWKGHNAPLTDYHGDKKAGDLTHYGDQMLWLLESIAKEHDFDLDAFALYWKEKITNYSGYVDGASKATLAVLNDNAAHIGSKDLSVAGRFAPLLYLYCDDLKGLLEAVEQHSSFTHDNPLVEQSSLYFAEVAYHVMQGVPLEETLLHTAKEYDEMIQIWVSEGFESRLRPTIDVIGHFGQSCGVVSGFPGVIHLLVKHQDSYEFAMLENAKAGGDSAARGLIVGTILGALHGINAIPQRWIDSLAHAQEIEKLTVEINARES